MSDRPSSTVAVLLHQTRRGERLFSWAARKAVLCLGLAACLLHPHNLRAEGREALAQVIKASGQNEYDDERHAIEVDGCTMTTYRWRDVEAEGWMLWSSFQFNMADGRLQRSKTEPETYFIAAPQNEGSVLADFAIIPFEMRGDVTARFERSNLRKTSKDEWTPSPRNDGTTHHYQRADTFFILHQGPDVIEKADRFTTAYREYALTYCINLG